MVGANFLQVVPDVLQEQELFLYEFDMFFSCFRAVRWAAVAAAVVTLMTAVVSAMDTAVFFMPQLWRSRM